MPRQSPDTGLNRFTKDNALMIEGYPREVRRRTSSWRSRDRAVKVREYLIKRLGISPEYVGVMPMGAGQANVGYHEGIAIVLLKKK
jgi:hypothetical protein